MRHPIKHFYVPIVVTLVVLIGVGMLAGCKIVQETSYDPQFDLVHDFSLTGANNIEYGNVVNSCIEGDTQVANRATYCRVIDGYEEAGDRRNWKITIARDPKAASPIDPDDPIMVAFGDCAACTVSYTIPRGQECINPQDKFWTNTWQWEHGCSIMFNDGTRYEGCAYKYWENTWYCDYRARKGVILKMSTGGWDYALRKLWDWSGYAGDTISCAAGIGGFMAGHGVITFPFLRACADGPM